MRHLLFALLIGSLYISSCRVPLCGTVKTVPAPYVKLTNGITLKSPVVSYSFYEEETKHLGKIKYSAELYKPRITTADSTFTFDKVAAFSDGGRVFANVGEKKFVYKCGDGRINIYASVFAPGSFYTNTARRSEQTFNLTNSLSGEGQKCTDNIIAARHHGRTAYARANFYIQSGDTGAIMRLRYKALREMIPEETHASYFLVKYKRTKIISPITAIGGLFLAIAGNNLASSALTTTTNMTTGVSTTVINNRSKATTGNAMWIAGAGITFTSAVFYSSNHRKLNKAVKTYNKD